jgi:hypothetical protein
LNVAGPQGDPDQVDIVLPAAEVTLWKGRYLEAWSFLMYNLSLSRLENEVQI